MYGSQPVMKMVLISPREIPTTLPSREVRDSLVASRLTPSPILSSSGETISWPVIASITPNPPFTPVFPHFSQKVWKSLGPRTDSMASNPSDDSRNL